MMKHPINKIYVYFLITFSVILTSGCSSSFKYMTNGDVNDAAFNAVNDFVNNHQKLQQKDNVFKVVFFDDENDNNGFYRFIIIGTEKQYLYNKLKHPNENRFPNNYLESENKLFLWYDDNKQVDSITVNTYKRYNLLIDDENGSIKYLDNDILDESKKGVIYFVCKNNIAKFEKIVSNKSIKYPKKLKCNGNVPN
jgi:hypothetical protein